MSPEDKDQVRALVLRAFYDFNERLPGDAQQTGTIAEEVSKPKRSVDEATLYLGDRGLLEITDKQGYIDDVDGDNRGIMARITSYGSDVIEKPQRAGPNFLDSDVIRQITIVNGTHVTGGMVNQQIVGGDNSGVMVNASTTGDIAPPTTLLPIGQLRKLLPDGSPEREAAEMLAEETASATPRLSRVANALEVLKAATAFGETAYLVKEWMQAPDVAVWLQHLLKTLL